MVHTDKLMNKIIVEELQVRLVDYQDMVKGYEGQGIPDHEIMKDMIHIRRLKDIITSLTIF